jgi:hypothetical protein
MLRFILSMIGFLGLFTLGDAWAQTSLYRNPKEMIDLDGWPFSGFHYSTRKVNWPSGIIGMRLRDEQGGEFIHEGLFNAPETGHFFEINAFGAIFNDVIFPPVYRTPTVFRSNSYLYWNMRVAYTFVPFGPTNQGVSHMVEMGVDVAVRYNAFKRWYAEAGVKMLPLGMTYHDLGAIPISASHASTLYANQFYVGASPFFRTGIYGNRNGDNLYSIDFTIGRQMPLVYGCWLVPELWYFDEPVRQQFNRRTDILMNGTTFTRKTMPLGGMHAGLGITFYFR